MADIEVDFFLKTLKNLVTSSNLEKHQLQSLADMIKTLREFLRFAEKKRNEHPQLVKRVRDVVSDAENIVELLVVLDSDHAFDSFHENRPDLSLDLKSVNKMIKIFRANVKQVLDEDMYDINRGLVKKLEHSSTGSGVSASSSSYDQATAVERAKERERQRSVTDVDFFLETLKNLIMSSSVNFIKQKKRQLQSLEEEIKYMRGFLKITEEKLNENSDALIGLMKSIRFVVSEADYIVQLFVLKANYAFDSAREHPDQLFLDLESVTNEIRTLEAEVKQILEKDNTNRVAVKLPEHSSTERGGGSSSSGGKETSKVVENNVVVGFEDEIEKLMRNLDDSGDGQLEIISIIGAGGGGKTTLAREVYNRPLIKQKFEICAWVNVSQSYNKTMKRNFLLSILESALPEGPEKLEDYGEISEDKLGKKVRDYKEMSEDMLGQMVLRCLKDKRYLIVMDDVWSIDAWNDIQRSFPKERKRSKVLLTSRVPLDQPNGIGWVLHCLNPLPKKFSWKLLREKVFGKRQCPQELVEIGEKIAEKCEGLPLAIVTVAGILATKDERLEVWGKVAKNVILTIAQTEESCKGILELSYNDLPLHLKACLLYIGGYPEDKEIHVRELIWLWIAEGFIEQPKGRESLEVIAKRYLDNLVGRSLVMVAGRRPIGTIKTCRVHDLLRELCLEKAKDDNFLVQIKGDHDSLSASATKKHRRLFIGEFPDKFSSWPRARNLRSLMCSSFQNPYFAKKLSIIVENCKLLRVLHCISDTRLGEIGIGDRVHLRYLALRISEGNLFRSQNIFHHLLNLEILNLEYLESRKISLPPDTVKMVKLRHLYSKSGTFQYHHASYDQEGGNVLKSLQTLHRMCICEQCLHFLKRTPNLRKLGLRGELEFEGADVFVDLEFLEFLEILKVNGWHMSTRMVGIELKLPSSLMQLTLSETHLEWEKLSTILQTLPKLEVLNLKTGACSGAVWDTREVKKERSAPLKYLMLEYLEIEEWNATEDQFLRLEVLLVVGCRELKEIPVDFAELNDLREIRVEYSSRSAKESAEQIQDLQKDTKGEDACVKLQTRGCDD